MQSPNIIALFLLIIFAASCKPDKSPAPAATSDFMVWGFDSTSYIESGVPDFWHSGALPIMTGNTRVNLFIEILCVGSYILYCYIAIERMHLPLYWAWMSEFVYWGTLFVACLLYLRTGKWRNKSV